MRTKNARAACGPIFPAPRSWQKLIERQFGQLTVLGFAGAFTKHRQKMITCRCDCGLFVDVMRSSLTSGSTQSCGCVHSASVAARNRANVTHGDVAGGMKPLYRAWQAIKTRCFNKNSAAYPDYGGRGITMYPAWQDSYEQFRDDVLREAGPKPSREYSINRIVNEQGYVPGNINWATSTQQNRNRRVATALFTLVDVLGERSLYEWSTVAGVPYDLVRRRVNAYGWPLDEALGTPPGAGRCPIQDRVKWTSTEGYRAWKSQ